MFNNKKLKKKIIIFNPSIEDGGVEKNLYIIANYFAKQNLNVSLISSDISKKKKFLPKINFIHSKFFISKKSGRYAKYFSCLVSLINLIWRDKNYIVLSFQANIYSIIICLLFKIKIIARLNTAPQGWDHNYFKNKIYSFLIKKADAAVVNSLDFKKEVDKRFSIKTILIKNPFDFAKIKKLSKCKVKYPLAKKIKIINVGRLTDQKDQITILKSLTLLNNLKKISLIIIGKGKEKTNLINFIKKNKLWKNVRLLSYKNNPYPYIKKSDIFILSSKYEGSPNVLVEAQYLNKFIISTNCPTGPREILKNYKNSKLINVGDAKKMAFWIQKYKKKKNTNHFFSDIKNYDLITNCNKYIKLIEKLNDTNK